MLIADEVHASEFGVDGGGFECCAEEQDGGEIAGQDQGDPEAGEVGIAGGDPPGARMVRRTLRVAPALTMAGK